MAKVTRPLTNTEIKNAKPKDKEYNLSDGNGLYLRVRPSGTKLWLLNYLRPYTKKRANLGLGNFPDVSLAQAREQTRSARELLANDIDPKEHREEQRLLLEEQHSNTLRSVAEKWFKIKKTKITANYAEDIWRSLELHIFPDLGKVPLHKLKAANVIKVLEPIAAKGSLETIKRLCQRINEIMVYSVNTGLIDSNSLSGIAKAFEAPKKRHMPTIKPEQLSGLMQSLNTASIKIVTRCLIEWQLHTMVRPSEAAKAEWAEIDWENRLWNIPAEKMKSKRSHTVPLSDQCLSLLERLKPISEGDQYIFPADRDRKKHTHPQTANMALKRMGYGGMLVSHGLRALASTTLNEQEFSPDVIEAALAHIDGNEVRAAYNRADYLNQRRTMMYWWSNHIDQAATGNMSLSASSTLQAMS